MTTGPLPGTYRNPVWPHSFPDPFVLKHRGTYWAYCTGFWDDGRCFGVLESRDLVHWEKRAGALAPLPGGHTCYWAPEAVYFEGRFYLYYSVGNEERMEIRAAVADHPGGPFTDSGRRLTAEPFAIDAHVFASTAADGRRWLFYATDFLEHTHIGTGTVRDQLLDPFTLAGDPRPVSLPRYDWHVYHPNRPEKGFVRWHTVEGPFVLERKGVLYQMFSGGNWQNPTYGVSYATSRAAAAPAEWEQAADGERVLPVLRTRRGPDGDVIGPGHNSVVRGPDNRQLFCVYHRWTADARVLAIDRLDWAGERLLVLGPTNLSQPEPLPPSLRGPFDGPLAGRGSSLPLAAPSFLLEATLRTGTAGEGGFALEGAAGAERLLVPLEPERDHLLRLDVDGPRFVLEVDGHVRRQGRLPGPASALNALSTTACEVFGSAITYGWEDLFTDERDLEAWEIRSGAASIGNGRLILDPEGGVVRIARGPAFSHAEWVLNVRLEGEGDRSGDLEIAGIPLSSLPLPPVCDLREDQQLRCRLAGGRLAIAWESQPLGTFPVPAGPLPVTLAATGTGASVEMVRVTMLPRGA